MKSFLNDDIYFSGSVMWLDVGLAHKHSLSRTARKVCCKIKYDIVGCDVDGALVKTLLMRSEGGVFGVELLLIPNNPISEWWDFDGCIRLLLVNFQIYIFRISLYNSHFSGFWGDLSFNKAHSWCLTLFWLHSMCVCVMMCVMCVVWKSGILCEYLWFGLDWHRWTPSGDFWGIYTFSVNCGLRLDLQAIFSRYSKTRNSNSISHYHPEVSTQQLNWCQEAKIHNLFYSHNAKNNIQDGCLR